MYLIDNLIEKGEIICSKEEHLFLINRIREQNRELEELKAELRDLHIDALRAK